MVDPYPSRCVTDVLSLIVNHMVRGHGDRTGRSVVLLLTAMGCTLVIGLCGCGGSSGTSGAPALERSTSVGTPAAAPPAASPTYTLMQMNLCLSGLANSLRQGGIPGRGGGGSGPDP